MKTLKLKSLLMGAAFAVALTASASPAHAAWVNGPHGPDYRHERWDDHARHNHAWYVAHPHYVPGYVVAPPPVVYTPPPPSPGLNIILPLHFN
ncbi:MAG TPA: hypothetical protein VFR09_01580 [Alphaproteobacteria bacterium]|nr:hypothetical protein [Alphaproteobacteria bacterium]